MDEWLEKFMLWIFLIREYDRERTPLPPKSYSEVVFFFTPSFNSSQYTDLWHFRNVAALFPKSNFTIVNCDSYKDVCTRFKINLKSKVKMLIPKKKRKILGNSILGGKVGMICTKFCFLVQYDVLHGYTSRVVY